MVLLLFVRILVRILVRVLPVEVAPAGVGLALAGEVELQVDGHQVVAHACVRLDQRLVHLVRAAG